jgi:hypothetical protein
MFSFLAVAWRSLSPVIIGALTFFARAMVNASQMDRRLCLSCFSLLTLTLAASRAEDVVGFYRLAKRMEEACEALANHVRTVAPEIAEAAERFRRMPPI